MNNKKLLTIGIAGTILTALCCFTPVLVLLFGALGIAGLIGYLDYVLLPLLAVSILLVVVALFRQKRKQPS